MSNKVMSFGINAYMERNARPMKVSKVRTFELPDPRDVQRIRDAILANHNSVQLRRAGEVR